MLESMRLRNLRSFPNDDNAPYVELKPITVLIGMNSSGKSTFLRSLPLLRQSIEANTTGPILWYSSYVDFGAFSEAINFHTDENIINFDFNFNLTIIKHLDHSRFWTNRPPIHQSDKVRVNLEVGVSEKDNKTILHNLKVKIFDYDFYFSFFDRNRCKLELKIESYEDVINLEYENVNKFLPNVATLKGDKFFHMFEQDNISKTFLENLYYEIKDYFGRTSRETIEEGLRRIGLNSRNNVETTLETIFKNNKTFMRNFHKHKSHICDLVFKYSVPANINFLLNNLNYEVEKNFKDIKYVAPLRATAERYYRHQDLQVKEIDHTGSNMAMLLKSFTKKDKVRFSSWTSEKFGFKVRVEEKGLHYALKIQTQDDAQEYNINDMGFGFSQILPIVTSIWMKLPEDNGSHHLGDKSIIFAIEQPELHLHPEYQSKLAMMFASVINEAKEVGLDIKIVFETHSQTMVDTLGDCIEQGKISPKDVNIVLFDKESDSGTTDIEFSGFDSKGYLINWPIGFFSGRK